MGFIINPYMVAAAGTPFVNTYSVDFDGVDDYVEAAIDGTSTGDFGSGAAKEFTISMWVKLPVVTATDAIFHWADTSTSASTMVMIFIQSSQVRYYVGGQWGNSPTATLSTATWYHVVLTRTASDDTNRIYINGVLESGNSTTSATISNESNADNVYLMDGYYGNIAGNVDEFSMFTTALSQADITSIYNSGVPTDLTSLSPYAWWRMGDGDVFPTITDHGSGGNNGTMTNMVAGDIVADVP